MYVCVGVCVCVWVGDWLCVYVCVSVYVYKYVYAYVTYMEIAQKLYKNDFIFSLNVSLSYQVVKIIFVPHYNFFAKKTSYSIKISQTGYINGQKGIFQHENEFFFGQFLVMLIKFLFTSYSPPCLFWPNETKSLIFWHFNLTTILFGHINTVEDWSPKRPSPKGPVAETSHRRTGGRRNVPSPKRRSPERPVAETASPNGRRQKGVAEMS